MFRDSVAAALCDDVCWMIEEKDVEHHDVVAAHVPVKRMLVAHRVVATPAERMMVVAVFSKMNAAAVAAAETKPVMCDDDPYCWAKMVASHC